MLRVMTTILIVEDHSTVAQMIARFIERYIDATETKVVSSGEEALAFLAHVSDNPDNDEMPDLVLVDVSLPGMSGLDLVGRLKEAYPSLLCLMLSGHKEPAYVQRSMDLGARGYVAKGNPPAIVEGVNRVLSGETYISDDVTN